MSSKLSSPKHTGKDSGWVFSKDPFRKSHGKRVRAVEGGETPVVLSSTLALSQPVAAARCLRKMHTSSLQSKYILCVLQNHDSERIEEKEQEHFLSSLECFKQEGRNAAKKAGNFLHPNVRRTRAGSRTPSFANCSRIMPGPGRAELQLRFCPNPPGFQEKEVTDASLLRRDEKYESQEVGGKLAAGSGARRTGSWMELKQKKGDP